MGWDHGSARQFITLMPLMVARVHVRVCAAEVLKDGVRVWKDIYISTEKHGECY